MSDLPPLNQLEYRRVSASDSGQAPPKQRWEIAAPGEAPLFLIEVYEGKDQWGIRLRDKAPQWSVDELIALAKHALIWHIGCPSETVDLLIGRDQSHHPLVRVNNEYL